MRWPSVLKWLGLAGAAGVAAGGVVVARDQRRRTALEPHQVRERLHRRLADAERDGGGGTGGGGGGA